MDLATQDAPFNLIQRKYSALALTSRSFAAVTRPWRYSELVLAGDTDIKRLLALPTVAEVLAEVQRLHVSPPGATTAILPHLPRLISLRSLVLFNSRKGLAALTTLKELTGESPYRMADRNSPMKQPFRVTCAGDLLDSSFRSTLRTLEDIGLDDLELADEVPLRLGGRPFTHIARALAHPERIKTLTLRRDLPGSPADVWQIVSSMTGLEQLRIGGSLWCTSLMDHWPTHASLRKLTFCRDASLQPDAVADLVRRIVTLRQLEDITFEQEWDKDPNNMGWISSGLDALTPADLASAVRTLQQNHPHIRVHGRFVTEALLGP